MSCVFEDPDCMIGLIVGTGTNACYMEQTNKIELISDNERQTSEQMIINCEWGNFGANGVLFDITSIFDNQIDEQSPNPGKQIFEKMISGMYLGELVRLILLKLHNVGVVFYGSDISSLDIRGAFKTMLVSEILDCQDEEYVEIQNLIMNHIGIGASVHDCKVVHQVCRVISKRSSMLCACGVAAIVYQLIDPERKLKIDSRTLSVSNDSGLSSSSNSNSNENLENFTNNAHVNLNDSNTSKGTPALMLTPPPVNSAHKNLEKENSEKPKKRRIVCGVDGTVYRRHPTFARDLKKYTDLLVPNSIDLEYKLSHDGSGKGAALTALVAELTAMELQKQSSLVAGELPKMQVNV